MARLMLYYGGELRISNEFTPTYDGGRNRPLLVADILSLEMLKVRIMHALRINPTSNNINLTCRFRDNGGYYATHVVDDEVCEFMLMEARAHTVVVYVEVEQITQTDVAGPSNDAYMGTINYHCPRTIEVDFHGRLNLCERPTYLHQQLPSRASVSERRTCETPDYTLLEDIHQSGTYMQRNLPNENVTLEFSQPPGDEATGYETMNSGSTNSSHGESPGLEPPISTGEYDNTNLNGQAFIQDHARQNRNGLDGMNVNNDFVEPVRTTQQWDETKEFDAPCVNITTSIEANIPTELFEGQIFHTKEDLQSAINGWSIVQNVQYINSTSNKTRLSITCTQHDNHDHPCHWRLHAARSKRLGGLWKISTCGPPHTCTHPIISSSHHNCTSKFICRHIIPIIRQQLDMKLKEIIARMESKFEIKISYMKAWDARRKAIEATFGSYEESYHSLYHFMEVLRLSLPGTVYNIQLSGASRFKGLFWAFGPSNNGWQQCRPVLSLDGTFLLGKFRGTLLAAVGIDGNGGLYPLAFAVVESESNESWLWFLQNLHDLVIQVAERENLCIISDKHPCLVRGCREVFPNAVHRHCLRHLRENFKKYVSRLRIPDSEGLSNKMYFAADGAKWVEEGQSSYVPRMAVILQRAEREARRCPEPVMINRKEFEVINASARPQKVVIVGSASCTYTCMKPQLYYVPCVHVVAVYGCRRWNHNAFVSPFFTIINFNATYSALFHVIPPKEFWPPFNEENGIIPMIAPAFRRRLADSSRRRRGGRRGTQEVEGEEVQRRQMSIASLGSSHRAHDPDQASPLVASTHLRMAREWPVECPRRDTVYHAPGDEEDTASFRMGSAQVDSMLPLRWLRWTFYKDSYEQLAPGPFLQHVRAYVLFMIGCFLIPDTSRSHVWAEDRIRELPTGNTMTYRDEFDGLRVSQVSMAPYTEEVLGALPQQCHEGRDIWRARVPFISWKRAEWHLPDRVMRQFGGVQLTDIQAMDQNFRRIDGRGRADLDWTVQYCEYLQFWDERRAYTNPPETFFPRSPGERIVADYYIRSSAIVEPLAGGHGENASSLQLAVDQVAELSSRVQQSVYIDYTTFDTTTDERCETRERGTSSRRDHGARRSTSDAPSRSSGRPHRQSTERETPRLSMYTPSTGFDMTAAGPSTQHWSPYAGEQSGAQHIFYGTPSQQPTTHSFFPMTVPEWMSSVGLPSSPSQQDLLLMGGHPPQQYTEATQHQSEEQAEQGFEEPQMQRRRRRAPVRYTPGSGALPRHR
ncbi:hypothetical protein M5K25_007004 [Dendrobium thyrsiflorum]|uniref:Mutator-like transposase n=1 Tax=Dendrobium thyrsiflorum TaxID=117978 RepID=A0ABD0VCM6_DENTH